MHSRLGPLDDAQDDDEPQLHHIFFQSQKSSYLALPFLRRSQAQPFIIRRHPAGIGPGRPIITIPVGTAPVPATPVPKLDWDQDPRLVDLSHALCALGWTPPC